MDLTAKEILGISKINPAFHGDREILNKNFSSVSIDSREIEAGSVFIAIKGERHDGHEFISSVVEKSALLCIIAKNWYAQQNHELLKGNFIVVDDTLLALQEISHYYRKKFDIPFLAITGSNGKTTTKEMIYSVLSQKYKVLKNPGNLNNHIGLPLTLLQLNKNFEFAITEMGTNHFGEISRLAEIGSPDYGIITNIGPAHLEFFGSLDGVYRAKTELWEFLEKEGKGAFVNMDDPYLRKRMPAVSDVIQYGFETAKDVRGELVGMDSSGHPAFRVDRLEIKLSVPGLHNAINGLAAVAVGRRFGVEDEKIKFALESFQSADKRMEILKVGSITIINDCYNSNSASAKNALQTLSQMNVKGRRIAVLADMFELGDRSVEEHKSVGKFCADLGNINFLFTTGKMSEFMNEAAKAKMGNAALHFSDKRQLMEFLRDFFSAGDTVLVKGSRGMAMEEVTQFILENYRG